MCYNMEYTLMKKNREKTVIKTSLIGILANVVLAGFKVAVGFLSNSIAIISDAINNLSDALSSIVTIIGTKLAGKAPDRKHPYGYGRIEYITTLVVSGIVLYAGITTLVESVKKIIQPEAPDYQLITLVILVVGIAVKIVLGFYVKKKGEAVNSDSLVASGSDALSDAILSASVLTSAIIYVIFHIDLEAYVSIFVSIYIIRSSLKLIRESVDDMLGARIESGLAKKIKQEVLEEREVKGAFDLMLSDYGPDKYYGSIHIEVLDNLSVADVDRISRSITKRVMEKYGVVLHTIGVYSVNTKNKKVIKIRKEIRDIVFSHSEVLQMHGFYLDEDDKTISFDVIIDFSVKSRGKIYRDIYDKVHEKYPQYVINITLDVDTSD